MKNTKWYYILVFVSLFSSCNEDLKVDTSAKGDFELFFKYLKYDYAYRDSYPFSMEQLRTKYLPQIQASNTQKTLAKIIVNVEKNELKDPHIYLKEDTEHVYDLANVTEKNPRNLETIEPFFYEIDVNKTTSHYTSGIVKSNRKVGYLYIKEFKADVGGTSSMKIDEGVKEIDAILKELIDKGITAMIVDIRSKAGGSSYVPRYVAQRFIDKKALYMVEYYPEGSRFKKKEWRIKPSNGKGFRKGKIALLSNGNTASGGEMFLLAMLQRDNVIHIGSNSEGAAGNIADKDLSNGWNIRITTSRTQYPNGTAYFKVGIKPKIIVTNDANYGKTHFNDKLIQRAMKEL